MGFEGFEPAALATVGAFIAKAVQVLLNGSRRPRSPDEMRENLKRDSGRTDP